MRCNAVGGAALDLVDAGHAVQGVAADDLVVAARVQPGSRRAACMHTAVTELTEGRLYSLERRCLHRSCGFNGCNDRGTSWGKRCRDPRCTVRSSLALRSLSCAVSELGTTISPRYCLWEVQGLKHVLNKSAGLVSAAVSYTSPLHRSIDRYRPDCSLLADSPSTRPTQGSGRRMALCERQCMCC